MRRHDPPPLAAEPSPRSGDRPRGRRGPALRRAQAARAARRAAAARARAGGDARGARPRPDRDRARRARRRASGRRSTCAAREVVVCEDWADGQSASLRAGAAGARRGRGRGHHASATSRSSAREVIAGVLDQRGRHLARARHLRRHARPPGAARAARCSTTSGSCAATWARATCCSATACACGSAAGSATRPTSTRRSGSRRPSREARAVLRGGARRSTRCGPRSSTSSAWRRACPGAAITEHDEDGTYHGTFQVKLGPTTAAYRGTIRIESADEARTPRR